jgi:hypothetical protein
MLFRGPVTDRLEFSFRVLVCICIPETLAPAFAGASFAAAGVAVSTARDALKTAKEIGLVTVERLMGNYDVRSRTPTWLAARFALRELCPHRQRGKPSEAA